MKASMDWLKDFVDLDDLTPQEIADKLTMAGLEVEELSNRFAYLEQVVAARVEQVTAVDGSDHLRLCRVDAGPFGKSQVICGAPNVVEGMTAPLALPGAALPNGQTVTESRIRGHISSGMLCSEMEIGLGPNAAGLMPLDAEPGRTMAEISGKEDWVMEIGITPNRPDGLSITGLARDLSALLNRPLRRPEFKVMEEGPDVNSLAGVVIDDPEHCLRFAARVIKGVKIGPSPAWLADRLAAVGIRPVNNVVDATNYVMIEMGQPLHAYDLNAVAGRRLIARVYPKGGRFTTLDGQERELTAEVNLMICDGEKPVGLAGIMGGLNSEIEDTTTDIMLEGAHFNATTIRKTSRALGLSTDASYRFERGCDPEICGLAVDRAIAMIHNLAGGQVASGRIDVYPKPFKAGVVLFSPSRCNAYLGTLHKDEDMIRVLEAIGIKCEDDGGGDCWRASLPSWRPDLFREVDVWEEVARLLDFDKLPATLPLPPIKRQDPPPAWTLRAMAREHLMASGFSESITYSFINANFADKLGLAQDSRWRKGILSIMNPLSEEQGTLRPLMAPSLLNALRVNQSHGREESALYELGAVFLARGADEQPDERLTFGGVWSGKTGGNWLQASRSVDFWDIKGLLEGLAEHLNIDLRYRWSEDLPPWYDPAEAAMVDLEADGEIFLCGHLGRLNKKAAKAFGLKEAAGPAYLFELDAQRLLEQGFSRKPFAGWSKFPPNQRDMALVLDSSVPASEVISAVKSEAASMPLTDVLIFDLYQGDQLPEGRKSLAFRLTFQAPDRTLADEEVGRYFQSICDGLSKRFSAELRS